MPGLTEKDAELISGKLAEDLRNGLLRETQDWVKAYNKTKFELTLGINCEDEDERRETRKTVEFGHKSRQWFESEKGQKSMEALERLVKMLGTEEGAEKLQTLERFAKAISGAERWVASRFVKALAVGLLAIAFIGLQSGEALREIWKNALRAVLGH
jgi:hypothetical protein